MHNFFTSLKTVLTGRYATLIIFGILFALNPLVYNLNNTASAISTDSTLYIAFGNNLLATGSLVMTGWSHIDSGVVLSPIYPLLVGSLNLLNNDGLYNALLISTLTFLLMIVPLYFLARGLSSPLVAVIAIVLVQVNANYIVLGSSALAEATFLFILAVCIYLSYALFSNESKPVFFALTIGFAAALLFLTRQIGIFYIPVFFSLVIICWFKTKNNADSVSTAVKSTIWFVAGYSLLAAPYSIMLYQQSEQTPFAQHYRTHQYVISSDLDLVDLQKSELNNSDTGSGDSIKSKLAADDKYLQIYIDRRKALKLLPDASEMLSHVKFAPKVASSAVPKAPKTLLGIPFSLANTLNNLAANFSHATNSLGWVFVILFLICSCFAYYTVIFGQSKNITRAILPTVIIIYFATLSLLSGFIERYISILFVLVTMLVTIEVLNVAATIIEKYAVKGKVVKRIIAQSVVFVFLFVLTPQIYSDVRIAPRAVEYATPMRHCRQFVEPREPVFSLLPTAAYLIGGSFRKLPNDNLRKIAMYAEKTGVRWIILRQSAVQRGEAILYENAPWLMSDKLLFDLDPSYQFRCGSLLRDGQLYEIMRPSSSRLK